MNIRTILLNYPMTTIHQVVVNSKSGSDAAETLGVSYNTLYRYLANFVFDGRRLSCNLLKKLPKSSLNDIQLRDGVRIPSINNSLYTSSMIDDLISQLRDGLHDRPNIKIADNLPIQRIDGWCRFISANYARYDYLLLPLNINNNHWVLVYINRANNFLAYIDPFGTIPPDELFKGLNHLKIHERINFNTPYISSLKLQNDNYQCGPWLMVIMQMLVAGSMDYDSELLASLLLSLQCYDIAEARFEQQQYLASEVTIEPLLGKRVRSDAHSALVYEEPKAKQHYATSSSRFISELSQEDKVNGDLKSKSSSINHIKSYAANLTGYQAALKGSRECLDYANGVDYLLSYYQGYFDALAAIGILSENDAQHFMTTLNEQARQLLQIKDDISVYRQALSYLNKPEIKTWLTLCQSILRCSHFPFGYYKVPVVINERSDSTDTQYQSDAIIINFDDYALENSVKIVLSLKAKEQLARLFTMTYQQILGDTNEVEAPCDALKASFHQGYLFIGHYSCLPDLMAKGVDYLQKNMTDSPIEELNDTPTNYDRNVDSDNEVQSYDAFTFFIEAVNKKAKQTEGNSRSPARLSNGFFALSNSSPRVVDLDSTDDELSVTPANCEDDNDEDALYPSFS